MFAVARFEPADAAELAAFLNYMRINHWALTSMAFARRPQRVPQVTPQQLLEGHSRPHRIGTFLLRHQGRIVSTLQIDASAGNDRVAVFSGVETHPDYQRRGTFWRYLGSRCLREICGSGFQRIEADTWPLNRKGIPLYKRVGFRAVPGTALRMENYLPLIVDHPTARCFFQSHDFLRHLQHRRSYGHDGRRLCGVELFTYEWRCGPSHLCIQVDRERKQIVGLGTGEWLVRCFYTDQLPQCVCYHVHNHAARELVFGIHGLQGGSCGRQLPLRHSIAPRQTVAGHLRVTGEDGQPFQLVEVICQIDGTGVPFRLSPQRAAEHDAWPAMDRRAG